MNLIRAVFVLFVCIPALCVLSVLGGIETALWRMKILIWPETPEEKSAREKEEWKSGKGFGLN